MLNFQKLFKDFGEWNVPLEIWQLLYSRHGHKKVEAVHLLNETGIHLYEGGWCAENVQFIRDTVTIDYLHEALRRASLAVRTIDGAEGVAQKMLADFEDQSW